MLFHLNKPEVAGTRIDLDTDDVPNDIQSDNR